MVYKSVDAKKSSKNFGTNIWYSDTVFGQNLNPMLKIMILMVIVEFMS